MSLKEKEIQASVYKNLLHIFVSVKMMYTVIVHLAVLINCASANSSRKDCFLHLSLIRIYEKDSLAVESGQRKDEKVST